MCVSVVTLPISMLSPRSCPTWFIRLWIHVRVVENLGISRTKMVHSKPALFFITCPSKDGLYARVDLVPFLRNDLPPESFPPGHMRRSNGWKYKVTENPNINTDGRHLAVTGACDGVPLFKDKNALSGWPFLLRPCIADGLSTEPAYSHLVAYQTCVYQDEVAGKIVSVSRYICVSHVANTCFITNNC
jgi:hypothetical protein